jgi:hypothetical protein
VWHVRFSQQWVCRWQPSGIYRCVVLFKLTGVSEVHTASIIRTMMEAVCTSEVSVYFNKTTQQYIPESCHLYTHCHENLKFHRTNCTYLGNNFGWMADICGYNSIGLERAGVPLSIMTRLAFFSNSPAAWVRADFDDFRKWDSSWKNILN